MNSLYGRFAMKPINHITKYIDRDEDIFNLIEHFDIYDHIDIDRDTLLLTYSEKDQNIDSDSNSISIASAIIAYSRIHMRKFKINPEFTLLYTDTDSGFLIEHCQMK